MSSGRPRLVEGRSGVARTMSTFLLHGPCPNRMQVCPAETVHIAWYARRTICSPCSTTATMQPGSAFGPRLRHERERRQIDLKTIANDTKISRSLLEALERDDVSRWPTGIFRRAFIRSYAEAIGLNADEIVREFAERFPDPTEEPAPRAGDVAQITVPARDPGSDRVEIVLRFSVPRWIASWMSWRARTTPGRQNT